MKKVQTITTVFAVLIALGLASLNVNGVPSKSNSQAQAQKKLAANSQRSKIAAQHQASARAAAKNSQQNQAQQRKLSAANSSAAGSRQHQQLAQERALKIRKAQLASLAHIRDDMRKRDIVHRRASEINSLLAQKKAEANKPKAKKPEKFVVHKAVNVQDRQHVLQSQQQALLSTQQKASARNNYEQLQKKFLLEIQERRPVVTNTNTHHKIGPGINTSDSPMEQWHKDVVDENLPPQPR